jgi:hypothetical protein
VFPFCLSSLRRCLVPVNRVVAEAQSRGTHTSQQTRRSKGTQRRAHETNNSNNDHNNPLRHERTRTKRRARQRKEERNQRSKRPKRNAHLHARAVLLQFLCSCSFMFPSPAKFCRAVRGGPVWLIYASIQSGEKASTGLTKTPQRGGPTAMTTTTRHFLRHPRALHVLVCPRPTHFLLTAAAAACCLYGCTIIITIYENNRRCSRKQDGDDIRRGCVLGAWWSWL